MEDIPSAAVVIASTAQEDEDIRKLADALRRLPQPVIGRIHNGTLLLDLRCLEQEKEFTEQLPGLKALL